MSQIITKKEIHDAVINALNTLIYRKAQLELNTNQKINYQFFDSKINYHFEDLLKIQIDYAFDRLYTTLIYDSENNKQCSIKSITSEVFDKGYHEQLVENAKKELRERGENHLRIILNDKEILKYVL